jgi:hypothetical protein
MTFFHEVAAVTQVEAVNGFVAAKVQGEVVAVFNDRTETVQVFNPETFDRVFAGTNVHCVRRVRVTKGNDARCMFAS